MGSEQADEFTDEDGPATNPLRLHRLMRNQRESIAHFVSCGAFLQARNERTVRQQHHRPSRVFLPPLVFCLPLRRKTSDYNFVYYAFVMTMQFEMAKPK